MALLMKFQFEVAAHFQVVWYYCVVTKSFILECTLATKLHNCDEGVFTLSFLLFAFIKVGYVYSSIKTVLHMQTK
jgi:urea transporter